MERIFDYPVTPEAKERMSFEERFEGFCVDLIKVKIFDYPVTPKATERMSL